jgi:hypothetical protein
MCTQPNRGHRQWLHHNSPPLQGRKDLDMSATKTRSRKGRRDNTLNPTLARRDPDRASALAEGRVRPDNPLRRVRVHCCEGWRRDADATVSTWVWCAKHADWARVTELAE